MSFSERDDYAQWMEYGQKRGWIKPNYSGVGPKNYKRSDAAIEDEIHDKLSHNRDLDASDIEIEVKNGNVVLSGFTDSKFEKRLAEEIVEQISGVRKVTSLLKFKSFGFQTQAS